MFESNYVLPTVLHGVLVLLIVSVEEVLSFGVKKRYAASKQLSSSAKILADLGRSFPVAAATFDKCYGAKVRKPPFSPLSPPFFLSLFSLFVFFISHSLSLLSLPLSSLTSPFFFLPLSSLSLFSLSLTSRLFSLPFSLVLSPSQVIIHM